MAYYVCADTRKIGMEDSLCMRSILLVMNFIRTKEENSQEEPRKSGEGK